MTSYEDIKDFSLATKKIYQLIIETTNGNVSAFADLIGLPQQNVNRLFCRDKRSGRYPNVSSNIKSAISDVFSLPEQWFYSEDPKVLSINQTGNNNVAGNHNKVTYGNVERAKVVEADTAPIVPTALARKPNFDVLPFLSKNPEGVEMSSVNVKYTEIAMWYRVQDDSLSPNYLSGDLLGLQSYPQGQENPIPGKLYAVDSVSNGIVVRLLYPCEGGYVARAYNEEKYPEFVITKEDIIRIYRTIVMVRF